MIVKEEIEHELRRFGIEGDVVCRVVEAEIYLKYKFQNEYTFLIVSSDIRTPLGDIARYLFVGMDTVVVKMQWKSDDVDVINDMYYDHMYSLTQM